MGFYHFSADPSAVPKVKGLPGIINNIQKGYMMAQLPEKMKRQRQSESLKNEFLQAKIKDINNPASRFTGDSANAYNLERIRQASMQDPSLKPYYDRVSQQYNQKMQSIKDTGDWRRGLSQSMMYRSASPLGKLSLEKSEIDAGFLPHTNRTQKLSPSKQKNMKERYGLMTYKVSTDANVRQKIGYVTNLDATLSRIDPEKLTQYSGEVGSIESFINKAASSVGAETKNYDEYLRNVTSATLAAKQLRQFLGDSIQPHAAKKLEALTNPSTWTKNPKQAKMQLKEFMDVYKKESQTYRDLANHPSIYQDNNMSQSQQYRPSSSQGNGYYSQPQPQPQSNDHDYGSLTLEELQILAERGHL